ncbi:MAG: cbb3-type cytochrome oxidase assembly protein CcoS [Thermodesulfovibrionales bacterium]
MWTIGFLIFLSIILGIGAWLFFVWSVKSGQYDDPEGPKYRMLEDEDDDRDGIKKKPDSSDHT